MTSALDRIIDYKKDEVAALKRSRSSAAFERAASSAPEARGFAGRLKAVAAQGDNALICEIKRKSPSAGLISGQADPATVSKAYAEGGAACISVLTDSPSFGGSLDDLDIVRKAVSIPIIRKDFMIDVVQVLEARAHGADAILVIMAAVDDELALDLHEAAVDLGMSVLIEAHDEAEFERALKLSSPLIGVNNRDLRTFTTDLGVTERLSSLLPHDRFLIAESGLKSAQDVARLRACGAKGFLVGESLMKADGPKTTVNEFVRAR